MEFKNLLMPDENQMAEIGQHREAGRSGQLNIETIEQGPEALFRET